MAQKRMFSLQVVDTDRFLDMPTSTQALYFHLGMHGDDDGFVSSPKRIAAMAGCNEDDMTLLVAKGFIIPFASGVVVVTDWLVNNTLKNDRYHPTIHQLEKAQLSLGCANQYVLGDAPVPSCLPSGTMMVPDRFQSGSKLEPQPNLTKPNVTKQRKKAAKPPQAHFIPPTLEEVQAYCEERQNGIDPEHFMDYYTANGWVQGRGKPLKDWKAAVRNWEHQQRQQAGKKENDIYGSAI